MTKSILIVIILLMPTLLISASVMNMNLKLEMYKFLNNYGVKADGRQCERKCLTFFSFCLKLRDIEGCLAEFETQIIGENSIEKDEFNQTTDLIEFPVSKEQLKVSFDESLESTCLILFLLQFV
jgi:hypothetical protein